MGPHADAVAARPPTRLVQIAPRPVGPARGAALSVIDPGHRVRTAGAAHNPVTALGVPPLQQPVPSHHSQVLAQVETQARTSTSTPLGLLATGDVFGTQGTQHQAHVLKTGPHAARRQSLGATPPDGAGEGSPIDTDRTTPRAQD